MNDPNCKCTNLRIVHNSYKRDRNRGKWPFSEKNEIEIFSEICIQNALETLLPSGGKSLVRVLCNSLDIALEHCVELTLYRLFGSIVHTCHLGLRDKTIVRNHMEHVISLASGAEGKVAVESYGLLGTVGIGMADNEEL